MSTPAAARPLRAALRRALRWSPLALALALLGAFGWLLHSEAGLRFALARADGVLTVTAARGTLAGPLVLEGLVVEAGGTRVAARRVALDLRSTPLLLGRLHLLSLEAEGVRIAVAPDPDAPPLTLPERIDLPLHLALERFALRDLEVAVGDAAPLAFAAVEGRASVDARGLRFDELRVEHARGSLRGRGSLQLAQPYPAEASLALLLARPGAEPLLTSIALDGRLEALRARIDSAAPLALQAELTLSDAFVAPRLAGRIGCAALQPAQLDPALATLGPTALDCALEVAGDRAGATLTGRLRAAHPDWRPATLDLELQATPAALELRRGALAFEGAALAAELSGRLGLADAALPFGLTVRAREVQLPSRAPGPVLAARAALEASGDRDAARGTLVLEDHAAGVVEAKVALTPRTGRFELDATARDLAFGAVAIAQAALRATGDADGAELALSASGRGAGQPLELRADGRLTRAALTLEPLRLELLRGRVEGRASLELGAPRWRATLAARDLDPSALDARFRGRVSARIALDGTPAATALAVDGLGGTLRERALGGGLALRYAPRAPRRAPIGPGFAPELALERLELTSGAARVAAAFDARGGRFAVEAPDLADLLPTGRGRLSARGAIAEGGATLSAAGAELSFRDLRLAALEAQLAAPAAGAVDARVALRGLAQGDLALDELTLTAAGPREALALALGARVAQVRVEAAARGAADPRGFAGTLEALAVSPPEAAPWTLAAPAALRVGADGLRLTEVCLGDGQARGCLGGDWHPVEPWRIAGRVARLPFAALATPLARGLEYHGTIDLGFEAAGRGALLGDARATLDLSAGRIVQPARRAKRAKAGAKEAPPAPLTLLEFSGGRIEFARQGPRASLAARFALASGGKLEADAAAVGSGPIDQRALSGRVMADLDQFALLPALLPELKALAGRVVADVALAGTVGEPRYSGRVAFVDGSAELPRYGLELEQLELEVRGDGDALALTGQARSGGLLQWRADVTRVDGRWRASGRLWGDKVRIVDVPEARVVASPALLLQLDGRDLALSGEVVVPSARIAPRRLETAVQATSDEVIVDPDGDVGADDALRVDARVRLKLGDAVEFDGFGLSAKVRGELAVTERPGALAIASGELALADGKYEAYGQSLDIERGRLLFSGGPVANPGLDVRATRTVERPDADEDVVVGIDVRGTLRSPETQIFAEPAMSSSDALSYLVIGRPMLDSTEAEEQQISDAASTMKVYGGEFIAQQIGRRVGLDDVRVSDADDPEQAQLWLGTYLSPRLFVSYGMGLFEQFHTARVRYQMSSKWSVEAESGRESSADFKYTIER